MIRFAMSRRLYRLVAAFVAVLAAVAVVSDIAFWMVVPRVGLPLTFAAVALTYAAVELHRERVAD